MIVCAQYLIKLSLIDVFIENTCLTKIQFSLLVISTVLMTASGYIINDVYDIKTDNINRKDKVIIGKHISSRVAIIWYFVFILYDYQYRYNNFRN